MDVEAIKALADLPIVAVLIYLLVREQAQKEKLLDQLCTQAQQHSKDLLEMAIHGLTKKALSDNGSDGALAYEVPGLRLEK